MLILIICAISLFLLFQYAGRIRSFGFYRSYLYDSVYNRRKQELSHQIMYEQGRESQLKDQIAELEESIEKENNAAKKAALESEKQQKEKELGEKTAEIETIRKRIEEEAKSFAQSLVPANVSINEEYGASFYIEFGTVLVIIFAILALSVLGQIDGQQAATILAAIVGYVLGKATRPTQSAAPKGEKQDKA